MQQKLFNLVIDDKKRKRYIVENTNGTRQLVYYDDNGKIKKLVGYGYEGKTIKNLDAKGFVLTNAEFHNIITTMNHPVNNRLPMIIEKQKHHINLFDRLVDISNIKSYIKNCLAQGWSLKKVDGGYYRYMDFER